MILLVSVLFNEPKLLKSVRIFSRSQNERGSFSALQRAEIAEISRQPSGAQERTAVSVLFNEPKLLKFCSSRRVHLTLAGFSALQRAEIAEIETTLSVLRGLFGFSALQRAEIAEILNQSPHQKPLTKFQCSSTSRNC